mmetsp:Transcript_134503/g.326889  ORF Transcript_134503/g.326889 Transcript_134503/m.326889 type:complete len:239 (+) Transcript_134503:10083-10799(+)
MGQETTLTIRETDIGTADDQCEVHNLGLIVERAGGGTGCRDTERACILASRHNREVGLACSPGDLVRQSGLLIFVFVNRHDSANNKLLSRVLRHVLLQCVGVEHRRLVHVHNGNVDSTKARQGLVDAGLRVRALVRYLDQQVIGAGRLVIEHVLVDSDGTSGRVDGKRIAVERSLVRVTTNNAVLKSVHRVPVFIFGLHGNKRRAGCAVLRDVNVVNTSHHWSLVDVVNLDRDDGLIP